MSLLNVIKFYKNKLHKFIGIRYKFIGISFNAVSVCFADIWTPLSVFPPYMLSAIEYCVDPGT